MEAKPFSLQQALAICKDFKHVVGKPYNEDEPDVTIRYVAVAPFDEENKNIFIDNYKNIGKISDDSLYGYYGPFYDVLVIANNTTDREHVKHDGIRHFSSIRHMEYTFPDFPFL